MSDKTNEETKVVVMRFDNADFEKKINKTQKSVDKLDKSLCFTNSKKDLEDFSKSLNDMADTNTVKGIDKLGNGISKVAISLKNAVEIKLVGRAVDKIVDKTKNLLVTMTGINNIREGWDAYNESLVVTGGILNQVTRDGYKLNDVAEAMDNLRWYADETSYSFQTMSDGIRQFTIAGIDLQKATNAVQGVANLAGSAKVFDAFKVQSGMDAISKAMQSGYMDTMKWTTLTNTAGIVTKDFSEKLLEAAAAEGTLIKSAAGQYRTKNGGMLVTAENIRDTLSKRWLTSDVLTNVLNEYSSATMQIKDFMTAIDEGSDEAWKNVNKNFKMAGKSYTSFGQMIEEVQEHPDKFSESLVRMTKDMNEDNITTRQAAVLLKELGMEFDDVSYKAFISSQETTSFGQAISYVATAIKTTWQGTFQSIFGDVEQSTALWSDVSDKFYNIFVTPFETIEETFANWSILNEGGAKDFRDGILNIVDAIGNLRAAASEGFATVFDVDGVELLQRATTNFKNFSEAFKNNETLQTFIKTGATVFASALKVIGSVLSSAVKILGTLNPLVEYASKNLSKIADIVANLVSEGVNGLTELDGFNKLIGKLGEGIDWVANKLDEITNWLLENETLATAWATIIDWINDSIDKMAEVLDKAGTELDKFKKKVTDTVSGGETTEKVADQGEEAAEVAVETMSWTDAILAAIEEIKTTLGGSAIGQFVIELGTVIKDIATTIFTPLVDAAKNGDLKAIVLWGAGILTAISVIGGIIDFFKIIFQAKNILQGAADVLWALEAKIRAGTFIVIARGIKDLAIAVGIIAASIAVIAGLAKNGVNIVSGAVTVGIILTVITGMAIGLTVAASKMTGGLGAAFMLLNLAIAFVGIAGAFIMVFKTLDKYKASTTVFYVEQIKSIMWTLTEMMALLVLVANPPLSLRKGFTINGSFFTLMGAFFVIYDLIQLMIKVSELCTTTAEDGSKTVDTTAIEKVADIITGFATSLAMVLFAANFHLPHVMNGFKSSQNKSTVIALNAALVGIAMTIWSIVDFCKMLQEVDMEKVKQGWENIKPIITAFGIFAGILAAIVLALDGILAITRLIGSGAKVLDPKKVEGGGGTNGTVGVALLGIAAAMYVVIQGMIKILDACAKWADMPKKKRNAVMNTFKEVTKATELIMLILGAVAVLVAVLGKAEKTSSELTKEKKGLFSFKREGAVKTPIIGILITIVGLTAAIIASTQLVAAIPTEKFWGALQRIGVIAGLIAAFVITLEILSKIQTRSIGKSSGIWEISTLLVGIAGIFASLALFYEIINDVSVGKMDAIQPVLITLTAILAGMAIAITAISGFSKQLGGGLRTAMLSLVISSFTAVLFGMSLVLKALANIRTPSIKAATPLIIALTSVISGMAIAVTALLSYSKNLGGGLRTGMLSILIGSFSLLFLGFADVFRSMEKIDPMAISKATPLLIALTSVIGGVVVLEEIVLSAFSEIGLAVGALMAVKAFGIGLASIGLGLAAMGIGTIVNGLPLLIDTVKNFIDSLKDYSINDIKKLGRVANGFNDFFELVNPSVISLGRDAIDTLNAISSFIQAVTDVNMDNLQANAPALANVIRSFVDEVSKSENIQAFRDTGDAIRGIVDENIVSSAKDLRSAVHAISDFMEEIADNFKKIGDVETFVEKIQILSDIVGHYNYDESKYKNIEKIGDAFDKFFSKLGKVINKDNNKAGLMGIAILNDLTKSITELDRNDIRGFSNRLNEFANAMKSMIEAMTTNNGTSVVTGLKNLVEQMKMGLFEKKDFDDFTSRLGKFGSALDLVAVSIKTIRDYTNEAIVAIDKLASVMASEDFAGAMASVISLVGSGSTLSAVTSGQFVSGVTESRSFGKGVLDLLTMPISMLPISKFLPQYESIKSGLGSGIDMGLAALAANGKLPEGMVNTINLYNTGFMSNGEGLRSAEMMIDALLDLNGNKFVVEGENQ